MTRNYILNNKKTKMPHAGKSSKKVLPILSTALSTTLSSTDYFTSKEIKRLTSNVVTKDFWRTTMRLIPKENLSLGIPLSMSSKKRSKKSRKSRKTFGPKSIDLYAAKVATK